VRDAMNHFESRQLIVVPVTAHWIGAPNSAGLRAESATCHTRIQYAVHDSAIEFTESH